MVNGTICIYEHADRVRLERISIECRKTKPKVITIGANRTMNQAELETNTCNRRQARENACEQVKNGFDFASHWLRYQPIRERCTAKPKEKRITFDT